MRLLPFRAGERLLACPMEAVTAVRRLEGATAPTDAGETGDDTLPLIDMRVLVGAPRPPASQVIVFAEPLYAVLVDGVRPVLEAEVEPLPGLLAALGLPYAGLVPGEELVLVIDPGQLYTRIMEAADAASVSL